MPPDAACQGEFPCIFLAFSNELRCLPGRPGSLPIGVKISDDPGASFFGSNNEPLSTYRAPARRAELSNADSGSCRSAHKYGSGVYAASWQRQPGWSKLYPRAYLAWRFRRGDDDLTSFSAGANVADSSFRRATILNSGTGGAGMFIRSTVDCTYSRKKGHELNTALAEWNACTTSVSGE